MFDYLLGADARARKKKSRWGGSENDKTFIPGMPTILPATLDPNQQEAYLGEYKYLFLHSTHRFKGMLGFHFSVILQFYIIYFYKTYNFNHFLEEKEIVKVLLYKKNSLIRQNN